MAYFVHFRNQEGQPVSAQLRAGTVDRAIQEGKNLCEDLRRAYVSRGGAAKAAYVALEITDESRNGYTVWQNEAACGVRGWR